MSVRDGVLLAALSGCAAPQVFEIYEVNLNTPAADCHDTSICWEGGAISAGPFATLTGVYVAVGEDEAYLLDPVSHIDVVSDDQGDLTFGFVRHLDTLLVEPLYLSHPDDVGWLVFNPDIGSDGPDHPGFNLRCVPDGDGALACTSELPSGDRVQRRPPILHATGEVHFGDVRCGLRQVETDEHVVLGLGVQPSRRSRVLDFSFTLPSDVTEPFEAAIEIDFMPTCEDGECAWDFQDPVDVDAGLGVPCVPR